MYDIEDKKLLAKFMGYQYFPWTSPYIKNGIKVSGWINPNTSFMLGCKKWRTHKDLPVDWQWLMDVYRKILIYCDNLTNDTHWVGSSYLDQFGTACIECDRPVAFVAIVNLVKLINQNEHKNS
jgi:hypothetical protein